MCAVRRTRGAGTVCAEAGAESCIELKSKPPRTGPSACAATVLFDVLTEFAICLRHAVPRLPQSDARWPDFIPRHGGSRGRIRIAHFVHMGYRIGEDLAEFFPVGANNRFWHNSRSHSYASDAEGCFSKEPHRYRQAPCALLGKDTRQD
jgi:hypothetical protein